MLYTLPTTVVVNDRTYDIRSDFRAALDIISVINDPEIDDEERTITALGIFYEDFDDMPVSDFEEAIAEMYRFIAGGEDTTESNAVKPKLMDWEQDFPLIIAPVNRVLGYDVRGVEYLHWWSFLSAYYEIGDCLFAQVVSIRKKRLSGKKLDKSDQEFYRANKNIVEFEVKVTTQEETILSQWT